MAVVIDRCCDAQIIENISERFPNETIVKTVRLKKINGATATHPDMQIHFTDKTEAVCAPECFEYYRRSLPDVHITAGSRTPTEGYPNDIPYNAARIGRRVIANTGHTEPKILEYYEKRGFEIINTKQGYTKCSLAILSDNAVITGDEGLYRLLKKFEDIKCLKTDQRNVRLSGYDHGFIGGACGLMGETAVFFGDVCPEARNFMEELGIGCFCAARGPLRDYGSIL